MSRTVTLSEDVYYSIYHDSQELYNGRARAGEQFNLPDGRYHAEIITAAEAEDRDTVMLWDDLGIGTRADVQAAIDRLVASNYPDPYTGAKKNPYAAAGFHGRRRLVSA
jgi:hypothetical protein